MSGPKIIRIVTREEIISICNGHLARLDAAIAEWKRMAERNGCDPTDISAVIARRDKLRDLLKTDRFTDLQKQVPAEISYLQADSETQFQKAQVAALEARKSQRRMASTAQMLLDGFKKSGREIPAELRQLLEMSNPSAGQIEAAINKAFRLLHPVGGSDEITERQRNLAEQLGRGEKRMTLAEWSAKQTNPDDETISLKIDKYLAELSSLNDDMAATAFEARASAISNEPQLSQRAILADSLLVELAEAVRNCREHARLRSKLAERSAELSRHSTASAIELCKQIDAALATENSSSIQVLLSRAEKLIAETTHAEASAARRRAVLQGLASLGYEVTEGMNTAWVKNGRVMLRKAANRSYGVELGGGLQSDRLQVRAIGFGSSQQTPNPVRDRDMEAIWCGEFQKLQALVAKSGGNVEIEQAYAVGEKPLKYVEDSEATEESTIEVPELRSMQRDN